MWSGEISYNTWDVGLSPPIGVPPPPKASGCTPIEEEDALWSIVVMCQEIVSARVKIASCVWETMSCAGGMSALGS